MLDGHKGKTGYKNKGLVFESYTKTSNAFFDMETNTREVIERMSGDTVLINYTVLYKLIVSLVARVLEFLHTIMVFIASRLSSFNIRIISDSVCTFFY